MSLVTSSRLLLVYQVRDISSLAGVQLWRELSHLTHAGVEFSIKLVG